MFLFEEDFVFVERPDGYRVLVAVNSDEAVLPLFRFLGGRLPLCFLHRLFL